MSLVRAIVTVGGLTAASRVAGFLRDILTAAILGAGPVADAFFVALKLPNLFRRLFAEGAFSVAFVPLFSAELQTRGHRAALAFAEEALAVMVAILLPLTVLALAGMPWLLTVIAPGFADEPIRHGLAVVFCRITFPYLLLMSLVALLGGVLNAFDRFAAFAAAPILFNLTLIGGLVALSPVVPTAGHGQSWAVAAAGIVQLLWLAAWCRHAGVRLRLVVPRLTPRVRRLFRLIGPGAIGAGVMQINLFFDVLLASLLPAGAISFLYYADRLYQLPLGVIGIAIGTAVLPALSRQVAAAAHDQALATQNRLVEFGLILSVPAAVALVIIAEPIVRVLFLRGAFTPVEAAATARALAAYALGIPAYILTKVWQTAYYARHDTRRPVIAAVIATLANIALSLALIGPLGHVGIALGTGVTAWLQAVLLAIGLHRRGMARSDARLRAFLPRLGVSAAGLAGVLYVATEVLAAPLDSAGTAMRTVALAGLIVLGAGAYFGLAALTGAIRPGEVRLLLRRRPA